MMRIKICGITRLEDALFAQESGADALGFIFYEPSKRYIDPQKAAKIIQKLNPFILKVGVFVNKNAEQINHISEMCGLTHVQLHGQEKLQIAGQIKRSIIKALNFSPDLEKDIEQWHNFDLMIDSGSIENPGGTGKTLPWDTLKNMQVKEPFILAGGLNTDNVEEAIRLLYPAALDVSSGVESAPGIKDHRLVKKFIDKVKGI